jgi:DNA helicase-2/ATP-dependent DNA helicase PcrA
LPANPLYTLGVIERIDWATRLSPAQYEAATRLDAAVCVLAGAGSGKTRAITHRIAYLILEQQVPPEKILAVTFTNKAAGEMKERVLKLVGARANRAQIGTFHGLAARILRRWGRAVGVLPSFVIYDADDWDRMLARIVVNDLNLTKDHARGIGALIDSWQSEGLLADQVPKGHELLFDWALSAYRLSRERLDQMGALDFGGLLLKWRDLLRSEAGPFVKGESKHILVDEYQDVNTVQAEIVLGYGEGAQSVAVVGDDDQAIYGWRGASASNLKRFLDRMPGAKLIKLEENYRSQATILEAANGIIAHNAVRLGKTLKPTLGHGRHVRVIRGHNDLEEARRVVFDATEQMRQGTSPEAMAILYRTNAVSRPFEDELRQHRIAYRIVGGVRFYDRKEVKDVLATLRCALNPLSDVDTLRFLSAVPRGIGDTTLQKVDIAAKKSGTSILAALATDDVLAEAGLQKATRTRCAGVAANVATLRNKVSRTSTQAGLFEPAVITAKDAVALAIETSGVSDRLSAEGTIEAEGRLENLNELLNAAAEWGEKVRANGEPDDVQGFLESAALLSSADEDTGREKLTLMTLHAAKGLEFDVVYLAALEEHGFPHSRALRDDGADELEEERRLAYVGITRAKKRLVLSYAAQRMVQGTRKPRTPSRFLFEIPRDVLDGDVPPRPLSRGGLFGAPSVELAGGRASLEGDSTHDRGHTRVIYDDDHPALSPPGDPAAFSLRQRRVVLTDTAFVPDGDVAPTLTGEPPAIEGQVNTGTRVWHKHFGVGVVVGMRGFGKNAAALVRFDDERQPRVIVARHLTLAQSGPEAT